MRPASTDSAPLPDALSITAPETLPGDQTATHFSDPEKSTASRGLRVSAAPTGGASAPRLEKRTHLNTGNYRIKLKDYGDGLAEIGWSFVPAAVPSKCGKGSSTERVENDNRAVRRARSRLRHLILSAKADHLLSLTYRENIEDYGRACADLTKFVRLVKRKHPEWVYVGVAEQQKRGAWHWHLAVCGRQDVNMLRSMWRRVVVEGNIDVNPPKGVGKQRALSLVRYLGKYLAKNFSSEQHKLNARRFRSSTGIDVLEQTILLPYAERGNVEGYARDRLQAHAGEVGYVWRSDKAPAGWACSWK